MSSDGEPACLVAPVDQLDRALRQHRPHCVLLDSTLTPTQAGVIIKRIRRLHPGLLIGQILRPSDRPIGPADFAVAEADIARRLLGCPSAAVATPAAHAPDSSGGLVWFETDTAGKLTRWSTGFASLLGQLPEGGKPIWPLIDLHPCDEDGARVWRELLGSAEPVALAGTVSTASGRELPVRLAIAVRRAEAGEIRGLRGFIHPEEDQLLFQPEWLLALLASTGLAAVLACGAQPRIVGATAAAWRFFGAGNDRVGRPLSELHTWPPAPTAQRLPTDVPAAEVGWSAEGARHTTVAGCVTWHLGGAQWWLLQYPEATERDERRELRAIADTLTVPHSDRRLLQVLSEKLAQIIHVACVLVVEFNPQDRALGRPVAGHGFTVGEEEPWRSLAEAPCGRLHQRQFICVARDLEREFAGSPFVAARGFQSFMGAVLHSEAGEEIGALCVFHTEPLQQVKTKRAIVMLHAMRSATALSHLRAGEGLREQATRLAEVQRLARIGGWVLDSTTDQLELSAELAQILERPECRRCPLAEFFAPESLARFRYHLAARDRDPDTPPKPSELELLPAWPVRFVSLLMAQPRNTATGLRYHGVMGDIMERVEAQHRRGEMERRFVQLIERAPVAFALIDRRGFVRYTGEGAFRRAGGTAARCIGRNILDLARTDGERELAQLIGTGKPARYRLTVGGGRQLETHIEPLQDHSGAPDGCFVLGVHAAAPASLRTIVTEPPCDDRPASGTAQLPLDKIATGLVLLGQDHCVSFCNHAAHELLGPDCPERTALFTQWARQLPPGPGTAGTDERVRLPSGLDGWLRIEMHRMPDGESVLFELSNLTPVKALQREAQLKHILLSGILDSLEDAVVTIDRQGHIVSANRAASEIFDWTTEDLLGQRIEVLLAKGVVEAHRAAVGEFLHSPEQRRRLSERGPLCARRHDGSTFPAEITLTKVQIEERTYLSAVISDVSEREEMRQRQAALTRELHNHGRFEALGRLVGNVAHDFNNLIMGISGFAEMALEEADQPHAVREDLGHVLRACDRARDLIQQMQQACRTEPAKSALVDLKILAGEVLNLCQPLKPDHCILRLDCSVETVPVYGHAGQLHEVLLNLLKNAWQAHRGRAGEVLLRLRPAELPTADGVLPRHAGMALIEVQDNGVGIPPDQIALVFEPFFTTKAPEEGTGLGLAVVRRIVDNHGGRIEVESQLGQGTTFRIALPQACLLPPSAPDLPSIVSAKSDLHGFTVWVIDDDQPLRHYLQRALASFGAEVRTFANSSAALGAARLGPLPSIVVTDRMLPQLDGVEFARRLHALHPSLPILLITGWIENATAAELHRVGILSVLAKPFGIDLLAQEIARWARPVGD